ncbi:MAG: hypothetical protein AAGJ08_05775 [Cyanobacteria bacterium P01_H01_bin.35]
MNRLLSDKEEEVLKDFGVLINPENIESHLEKFVNTEKLGLKIILKK